MQAINLSLMIICFSLFVIVHCSSFEPIQVMCEVNGFLVPAIIDTGAEITVMSSACARRCHISNHINTKYSGKAVGVGTSDILGGIDSLPIRIGRLNFQNKISILRESRCDFLIGLDILKRFRGEISLKNRILKLAHRDDEIQVPIISQTVEDGYSTNEGVAQHKNNENYPTLNEYDNFYDEDEDQVYYEDEGISMEGV